MTAPVLGYIRLPDDSGNTGKKVQEQSESIGGDTVYAPYIIQRRQARILGIYRLCMSQLAILATAHTVTATAFLYAFNPTTNTTKNLRVRRIWGHSLHSSVLATPTAPRVIASRFTFTGTPSGAALVPDKLASAYAASSAYLSAAITGATVTKVSDIGAMGVAAALTAVSAVPGAPDGYILDAMGVEDEFEVLAAGEGIAVWQDVNGTASDTRKAQLNMLYDEIDIS